MIIRERMADDLYKIDGLVTSKRQHRLDRSLFVVRLRDNEVPSQQRQRVSITTQGMDVGNAQFRT